MVGGVYPTITHTKPNFKLQTNMKTPNTIYKLTLLSGHGTCKRACVRGCIEMNLASQNARGLGNRAARRAGLSLYNRYTSRVSGSQLANPFAFPFA